MNEELTYEAAYNELQQIAGEIENEAVSVDLLAEKVKRAAILIEFCQQKLRATETEVNNIIRQMEGRPGGPLPVV
ncbi:exodeoxyribonuclease VII small subunit [Chitinophaga sp. 212800010-3]|jgi:exodeoxyribonuclease VII small subunit|uniref:exodeoxyribonuclease VII small subunit n=1 Tax=unclassified Chitinophaga TaxID=2619133 RepID=UPI002DEFC9AE|nr:Exodeoxyribonuclease 7 small subunit [Chitinophaga sp. 212800010-3]